MTATRLWLYGPTILLLAVLLCFLPTGLSGAADEAVDKEVCAFKLRHVDADAVAKVVKDLFGDKEDVRIAVDQRKNSLYVYASPDELAVIKQLLGALDQAVSRADRDVVPEVRILAVPDEDLEAMTDAELRAVMARQGLARAAEFRWEKTARETVAVYRKILEL